MYPNTSKNFIYILLIANLVISFDNIKECEALENYHYRDSTLQSRKINGLSFTYIAKQCRQ